jgi:cell division protein FtsN
VAARSRSDSTRSFELLLAHLTKHYAGTPEAERAQALLAHLKEQRAAAASPVSDSARSTAQPPSRSPSDSAAGPQARPRSSRTTEPPSDTSDQRAARPPEDAAEETTRQDTSAVRGNWTIVVASPATRPAAEKVASTYEDRFDPVRVISTTVDSTRRYRVTIGRYPSETAAERFLGERDSIPSEAWLLERP